MDDYVNNLKPTESLEPTISTNPLETYFGPPLLQSWTNTGSNVQHACHYRLVIRLADICIAVRDSNELSEKIGAEMARARAGTRSLCAPFGASACHWHEYRSRRHELLQRFQDIAFSRLAHSDAMTEIYERMRAWNQDAIQYNYSLVLDADLDQHQYISYAQVVQVSRRSNVSSTAGAIYTVQVAYPECNVVNGYDSDSTYVTKVMTALTIT
jgi:hypothetical protein